MIPSFERRHSAGFHLKAEGQLVAGAVGAVVGFYVGGPTGAQWGYAIGAGLYAVSQPGPHSEGPRLTDLKVTGTDYGQPIAWIAGHPRISGQIIYASEKRTIATTTEQDGGKGSGPTYTSYTYEVDLLFLLTDNEIAGVSRIWDNGKLIYSILGGSNAETLAASASTTHWNRISVYGGSATQLPDPTYEAAVGIGRAPAYRGRGTVFIEGLKLGTSGQLPNLTFEVVKFGESTSGAENLDWTFDRGSTSLPPIYANLTAFAEGGYQFHMPRYTETSTQNVDVYAVDRGETPVLVGTYIVPELSNRVPMAQGIGDLSGTWWANTISGHVYACQGQSGSVVTFLSVGASALTSFSRRGDYVYFCSTSGSTVTVKKYPSIGGGAITSVTHPITGTEAQVDTDSTTVYVYAYDQVHAFTAEDLTYVESFATPIATAGMISVCCDGGTLYSINWTGTTTTLYRRVGFSWQVANSWSSVDPGGSEVSTSPRWSVVNGNWYRPIFHGSSGDWNQDVWSVTAATLTPEDETLQSVVEQLLLRCGYESGEYDVSALASITKPVRALSVASIGATRATLETLMQAYYFTCVLSDKLYFFPRPETPVTTIEWDELGASNSPEGDPDPLTIKYRNELEVPAQIALSYINVTNDYQTGTEFSDRAISSQSSTTSVQIGLGMTPAEAKGIADAMVMDNYASLAGCPIKIPFTRNEIEAGDVVTVNGDGESFRMRLVKKKDSGGILEFEAVVDDVRALQSAQITDEDYVPQTEVQGIADTLWLSLDMPILRDADNSPGWYAVVKKGSGGSLWPGASLQRSWDGTAYTEVASYTDRAVFGVTESVLGNWDGTNAFDEWSSVQVNVGDGQLSSSTRTDMLADLTINVMLVGNEVIRFRTATMVSAGVYVLTGLIRCFRGTQWAGTGHAVAERAVLLGVSGTRRISSEAAQINVSRYIEAVTFNKPLSSATPETFTDTGIALKPFAATDLRIARDSSGNITGTFKRMTRLSFRFLSEGIDPPLGEAAELYDAVIYTDNTYTTVKRTIASLTSAQFTYSAADQTSDFGSLQATVYTRIYQRSAVVGRGYALQGAG